MERFTFQISECDMCNAGDNSTTAASIAQQCGILDRGVPVPVIASMPASTSGQQDGKVQVRALLPHRQ